MSARAKTSRGRQRIGELLKELGQLAAVARGSSPWLRGSLYARRRRCGKHGCRCVRGKLHQDMVLAMRDQGQSRVVAVRGVELERVEELTRTCRHLKQTRAELVRTFGRLLKTFDALARTRQSEWSAASREEVSPT